MATLRVKPIPKPAAAAFALYILRSRPELKGKTVAEASKWLQSLGYPKKVLKAFRKEKITPETLAKLTLEAIEPYVDKAAEVAKKKAEGYVDSAETYTKKLALLAEDLKAFKCPSHALLLAVEDIFRYHVAIATLRNLAKKYKLPLTKKDTAKVKKLLAKIITEGEKSYREEDLPKAIYPNVFRALLRAIS